LITFRVIKDVFDLDHYQRLNKRVVPFISELVIPIQKEDGKQGFFDVHKELKLDD